jgi:hypothetical protein
MVKKEFVTLPLDEIIPYEKNECHKETDNYGWKARWNND